MNASCKNTKLIKSAYLGLLICALGGLSRPVGAQYEVGPPKGGSDSGGDQQLVQQVKAALRADQNTSDKHIDVSIEKGAVVLRGFVFDDSDRRNAVRIAREAADGRKVVDNIELNEGGR